MFDTTRFRFIADALNGEGVFRPRVSYDNAGRAVSITAGTSALAQYPRESVEKFARRNEVAWYENHLLSACRRFVGYLAKKPPMREVNNPLLEDFADDCNWRGDSMDVFWQGFMTEAKARGSMLLLVDMPNATAMSMADQIEYRMFPYLTAIVPESLVAYSLDVRGRLKMAEISTTWQGRPAVKGWDTERWWITQDGKAVEGDDHNLGLCPMIAFTESGDFPAFGDFAQIVDISKRLFNARSELDEILRAQTFSLLTYQVPDDQHDFNAGTVAEAIGTHNMMVHRGDAPSFIAPPDGPAMTYLETIAKLEEALKRAALVVESPERESAESGVALTIRFQALNSALTGFARRMEDFERRTWEVVCRWLNLPDDRVTVEWAKDYALADMKTELEILQNMQLSGFPDAVIRRQQKRVIGLNFSAAAPEEMQELMDAVDDGDVEIDPAIAPEQSATAAETLPVVAPAPIAAPAPVIDMQPIADAIAGMKQPVVNVKVDAPVINMPEQQAPIVNIAAAPAPIVIVDAATTMPGSKNIQIQRDASGKIIGANVAPETLQ